MAQWKTEQFHGWDSVEEKLHPNKSAAVKHAKTVLKGYKGTRYQDGFYDHGNPVHVHGVEGEDGDDLASVHIEEHRGGNFAYRKQ